MHMQSINMCINVFVYLHTLLYTYVRASATTVRMIGETLAGQSTLFPEGALSNL